MGCTELLTCVGLPALWVHIVDGPDVYLGWHLVCHSPLKLLFVLQMSGYGVCEELTRHNTPCACRIRASQGRLHLWRKGDKRWRLNPSYNTSRPHQGRSPQVYLEGLVAHKDIAIQGEAQLAALEKHGICLRQLTVCMQQAAVRGSLLSLFVIWILAQAVPYTEIGAILRQCSLCLWMCEDTVALELPEHCVYSRLAQGTPCPYASHAQNSS